MAIRVVRLGPPRHQDEGVSLGTVRRTGILGLFPAADRRPVGHRSVLQELLRAAGAVLADPGS